jgi:hypothetical protein
VREILSVDVSNWDAPSPRLGKPAKECTRAEVLDEVWVQLKEALGDRLDPALLVTRHLDDNMVYEGPGAPVNLTPLLIHPKNSWLLRPAAELENIDNLVLASDYVKTNTDLASMEGANEAARRAVNAILDREGMAKPCPIWPMVEEAGPLVDLAKKLDRERFLAEGPHPLPQLAPAESGSLSAVKRLHDGFVAELRKIGL